ncbi:MAG: hypothetical protein KBG28_08865 [Kofleriaceae bacterium]|nr:hypothetical protein [Kofleriaceae bacterium]
MNARAALLLALLGGAGPAAAEVHGSLGAGPALVLTGAGGDRTRLDLGLDVLPGGRLGRFGLAGALRGLGGDGAPTLLCAGVVWQAAAARPRLTLLPYAEAGLAWADGAARAPVVGAGLRVALAVLGPVGVVVDSGAHLVVDGVADTRLVLAGAARLAWVW